MNVYPKYVFVIDVIIVKLSEPNPNILLGVLASINESVPSLVANAFHILRTSHYGETISLC